MSGFLDEDEDFLAGGLKFDNDEIVRLKCLSCEENKMYDFIKMKCDVLTGNNEGKAVDISVRAKPAHHKRQFIMAFWTESEIIDKKARLSDLAGKTFEARMEINEYEGKTYQNWRDFKKIVATLEEVNG